MTNYKENKMDDDIGSQYADIEAEGDWAKANNCCPVCWEEYDDDGNCYCEDDE